MPFVDGGDLFTARRALSGAPTAVEKTLRGPSNDVETLAKLRDRVSIEQANREMAAIFAAWSRSPEAARFQSQLMGGVGIDPPSVKRAVDDVRPWVGEMVLVLFGAVSFVLLIACANVANLLLVRAWSRQRELAVRAAMGASRTRLVSQVLTEALLLAMVGTVAGVGVAAITLRAIMHSALAQQVAGARLEPAVLGWSAGLSIVTALLFGSAPARFAAEGRLTDALKSGVRSASGGTGAGTFRTAMVGLEIALSVTLLAGAGLLVRTLVAMSRADLGMDTHGVVSLQMYFPHTKVSDQARVNAIRDIQARLESLPGVRSVSRSVMPAPEFGVSLGGLEFEDRPVSPSDSLAAVGFNGVEPAYFGRLGVRLVSGRIFRADTAAQELMVNERFARRFWPGGDAVGKRVRIWKTWRTIVGVVHDVDVPGSRDRVSALQLYTPFPAAANQASFVVRSSLAPALLEADFRGIVHDASALARVTRTVAADQIVTGTREDQRSLLGLLGVFAIVALLLAAIGLHAVIAFSVSQRTREIGMRIALGAESSDVVRLVVGQGLGIAASGVLMGGAAALASTRVLRSYLYGVAPSDPITLVAVAACLLVVAVLATLLPARRAARLDPIVALRAE